MNPCHLTRPVVWLISSSICLFCLTSCDLYQSESSASSTLGSSWRSLPSGAGGSSFWEWLWGADEDSAKHYLAEVQRWQYQDVDRALIAARRAHRFSVQAGDEHLQGQSLYWMGLVEKQGKYLGEETAVATALTNARLGLRLFRSLQDTSWQIKSLYLVGILHLRAGEIDSAKQYHQTSFDIIKQAQLKLIDSLESCGNAYHGLGNVYLKNDQVDSAFHLFDKARSCYLHLENNSPLGRLAIDVGIAAESLMDHEMALAQYRAALELGKDIQNMELQVLAHEGLGSIYISSYSRTGNKDEIMQAKASYRRMEEVSLTEKQRAWYGLGMAYHYQYAIEENESFVDSAWNCYHQAISYAANAGEKKIVAKAIGSLDRLCEEGSSCYERFTSHISSFQQATYANLLDTVLRQQRQADENLHRFNILQAETHAVRRQQTIVMWGVGIILGIAFFFAFITVRLKNQKLIHQMKALRAQINPHFVANTINAIEGLVNRDQREEASDHLIEFSRLNRQIISASRWEMIPLFQEISLLESYMKLMKLRLEEQLTYKFVVDPSLNPEVVWVPSLIVQPFIENAIFHGIDPKEEPGHLIVRFTRDGDIVEISVDDDGIGRDASRKSQKENSVRPRYSHGIEITEERMNILNNRKGTQVEIIDKYDKYNQSIGTRVLIHLPYKERKDLKSYQLPKKLQ